MDWIAGAITLYCCWLQGQKKAVGWLISFFAQFLWIYIEITRELYGLLLVTVPMTFLCLKNWIEWKKN